MNDTSMQAINLYQQNLVLKNNIRYLGRVLGATILAKDGKDTFDLVERIRQVAVKFHRENDQNARLALEILLKNLSLQQTISVVRAFSYFKHLVNIAEDLFARQQTLLNEDKLLPGLLFQ
ncbi:hypothetical protein MCEMSEM29_01634 [Methylophilaceae bacterium]